MPGTCRFFSAKILALENFACDGGVAERRVQRAAEDERRPAARHRERLHMRAARGKLSCVGSFVRVFLFLLRLRSKTKRLFLRAPAPRRRRCRRCLRRVHWLLCCGRRGCARCRPWPGAWARAPACGCFATSGAQQPPRFLRQPPLRDDRARLCSGGMPLEHWKIRLVKHPEDSPWQARVRASCVLWRACVFSRGRVREDGSVLACTMRPSCVHPTQPVHTRRHMSTRCFAPRHCGRWAATAAASAPTGAV